MITGKIRAERAAVINLEVVGLNRQENIEATIDTGFKRRLFLLGFAMCTSDLRVSNRRSSLWQARFLVCSAQPNLLKAAIHRTLTEKKYAVPSSARTFNHSRL